MKPHSVPETFAVKHQQIPSGEEEIRRGMAVFAKDGRIGRIDDVVVDPVSEHITDIILREGHLWGVKEVVVEIAHVKSVEDDGIHLKLSKAQIQHLLPSVSTQSPGSDKHSVGMNIPVHALVRCTDGDFGHSTCLIVNPINDNITHFVVNDRHLLGHEHIVPVSFITGTTEDRITVNCDRSTLAQQPDFIEYEYDRLDEAIPYREEHIYWPMMIPYESGIYPLPYLPLEHEQIPVGELAVRRGMNIYAAASSEDGDLTNPAPIGQVEAFVADPKTGHITHLVLREGHLWGKHDVTIPVNAISRIEVGDVQLNLTKQEIEALPSVPVKRWVPVAR